jgi:hypothetical protein
MRRIFYIDVVSMYPTVMSLDHYWYPKGEHEVRRFDDPYHASCSFDRSFWISEMQGCSSNQSVSCCLTRTAVRTVNYCFPLYPITGTWTHVELQKAVSLGYVIEEVYEQHHYPPSNQFQQTL